MTSLVSMLPAETVCDLDLPRVHAIIHELQSLSVSQFPNAVAMLYRGLVDMVAAEQLDSRDWMPRIKNKVDKKNQKPAHWMPSLDQMLRFLVKDIDPKDLTINASGRRALMKFVDEKNSSISLEGLNGFAHNRHESPNEKQLQDIAIRLRPLLAILLQKP